MTQAIVAPARSKRSERAERTARTRHPSHVGAATTTPSTAAEARPVFVDGGRRGRWVRLAGAGVGLGLTAWVALAASAVVGPDPVPSLRVPAERPPGATAASLGASDGHVAFLPFTDPLRPDAGGEAVVLGITQDNPAAVTTVGLQVVELPTAGADQG